jgi:hypothetical protein
MLRQLAHGERGQSMVVLLLSMGLIVASLALATDGGRAYLERRRLQTAADAGALAGAKILALGGSESQATGAANEYATQFNGAAVVDVSFDGSRGVTAIARGTSPTSFGGLIGLSGLSVASRATAEYGAVGWLPDSVLPIVVHEDSWVLGNAVDIYAGGGPGNYGWLGWSGDASTPSLCNSLTYPYDSETYINPHDGSDHILSVDDWVLGSTGVSPANCIEDALDALIGTHITVPIWNQAQDSGSNTEYHIVGFAKFELLGYHLPSQNRITGRFVRWARAGVGMTTGTGFGLYSVALTD